MEKERYRIIRKLAEGGSGITSLVWDERLSRQWVMKEIALQAEGGHTAGEQYGADQAEGQWQAVQAEIRALTAVRMDGIPFLADAWREGDKIYLIMEYLEGMTLEQRILTQGAMAETEVIRIGAQLASLLQYLHERTPALIHGDIKASNVICRKNQADSAALLDFGASFVQSGEYDNGISGGCHYTPGYAAPELIRTGRASIQTDIYAFGVLLYAMAAGELPGDGAWEIGAVRQQNPFLSSQIEAVIAKCVDHDPQSRYHTMEEVRRDLLSCGETVRCKRTGKKQSRKAEKRLYQRVISMLCTEGKERDMLLPAVAFLCASAALFLSMTPPIAGECVAAGKTLPVNLRSQSGDKILVDYGAVYHTRQNPVFELPEDCFVKERRYEVTLRQRDCVDGSIRERTFLICMD